MFNNIRGIISFRARGSKLYKFMNEVRQSDIICMEQSVKNEEYFGKIYRKDKKNLEFLVEEYHMEIFWEGEKGLIFKILPYKFRFGVVLGFILMSVFIFYFSNVIISIEIEGNTNISDERIISTLNSVGVYKGSYIPDLDFKYCEEQFALKMNEVAWVSMRNTGSRIVVEIDEMVTHQPIISKDIPCNIVSTRTAQISSVNVFSGVLMRPIGDTVKEGEILVSGVRLDSKGRISKLHSIAEIKGIYNEQVIFSQNLTENIREQNGGNINKKYFDFLGFRIPMFFGKLELSDFEYNETEKNFKAFGKKLPLGIVYSEYIPYGQNEVTYTEAEADILLEKKVANYENNILADTVIHKKSIQRNLAEGKIDYIVDYTLEGNIGVSREFFIKN